MPVAYCASEAAMPESQMFGVRKDLPSEVADASVTAPQRIVTAGKETVTGKRTPQSCKRTQPLAATYSLQPDESSTSCFRPASDSSLQP